MAGRAQSRNLFGWGSKKPKAKPREKRRPLAWLTDKKETYRRDVKGERADLIRQAKQEQRQAKQEERAAAVERDKQEKQKVQQDRAAAAYWRAQTRDVIARDKQEKLERAAADKQHVAAMRQTQLEIQEDYAHGLGARARQQGKQPHPVNITTVAAVKYFGRDKANLIARKAYARGYRGDQNPAMDELGYGAGRERARSLGSSARQVSAGEIDKQFAIWWEHERPYYMGGAEMKKAAQKAAYRAGWKSQTRRTAGNGYRGDQNPNKNWGYGVFAQKQSSQFQSSDQVAFFRTAAEAKKLAAEHNDALRAAGTFYYTDAVHYTVRKALRAAGNPCANVRKGKVSDRAKRYRANQPGCKPAGIKKCKVCGSKSDVMVDHADGDESNGRKSNLRWLCRSCNTTLGAEMARTGQGRRTVQYNPAHKGAQTLGEYIQAVLQHTRKAHDAAGKIIHDTPKAKRRQFASEIWASREAHGTTQPGTSSAGHDEPDWVTNPQRQKYLAVSKTLFTKPANLDGSFWGPTRLVSSGTPVHVLQARGKRIMVAADYYGTAYYGWVDQSDLTSTAGNPSDYAVYKTRPYLQHLRTFPTKREAHDFAAHQPGGLSEHRVQSVERAYSSLRRGGDSRQQTFPNSYNIPTTPEQLDEGITYGTELGRKDALAGKRKSSPRGLGIGTQGHIGPKSLKAFKEAYSRSYDVTRAMMQAPASESVNPAAAYYSLRIFDGVSPLGGKQEFSAPTLQVAQERAQSYADDMGHDAVLFDVSGKSLGRFKTQRAIYDGGRHEGPKPNPLPHPRFAESAFEAGGARRFDASKSPEHLEQFTAGFRSEAPARWSGQNPTPADLFSTIKPGSRVTIVNRFGQKSTGRAVMRGPHGWVLNMGGRHGTPAIADSTNVIRVTGGGTRAEFIAAGNFGNPEPQDEGAEDYRQAKRIGELFHGRAVKEEITVTEQIREHDWLWRIGPLVELKVKTLTKRKAVFPFYQDEPRMVHLFCSPDGRQFYLRGGDQEIDLAALGMGPKTEWFRDHMVLGEATEITYRDKKKFHSFKLTDYYHKLGEVTKQKPALAYNALAKKLEIIGGQYKVETEDLVDGMSPGIVN